jgi:hypothetical protein
VKDTLPPVSTLSALPPKSTGNPSIAVTVGGTGVIEYQWAVLTSASTCIFAQYSSYLPVATPLTTNVGAPGSKIICVRGRDQAGNVQSSATSYTWTLTPSSTPTPTPTLPPVQAIITSGAALSPNNLAAYSVMIGGVGVSKYRVALVRSQNTDCPVTAPWGAWTSTLVPAIGTIPAGNAFWTLCVQGRSADGREQVSPTIHRWLRFSGAPVFLQALVFGGLDRAPPTATTESIIINRTQTQTPAESVNVHLCKANLDTGAVSECSRKTVSFPSGARQMTVNYTGVGPGAWVAVGLPSNSLRGRIRHVVFSK